MGQRREKRRDTIETDRWTDRYRERDTGRQTGWGDGGWGGRERDIRRETEIEESAKDRYRLP